MIQKKIDETADRYMMLTNADRRFKLASVKRAEEAVSTVGFVLFVLTFGLAGFAGWMTFIGGGHGADFSGLEFEHVFFPIAIFAAIALARTAKDSKFLWVLLGTTVLATIVTKGIFVYFIAYALIFIPFEIKMAAMKNIPGYPAFADPQTEGISNNMTVEQRAAYEKKMFADMGDKETARARDSENLDKILKGEMDLDGFLGVEKIDNKNATMDYSLEYHEPQVAEQEDTDDDDDSAEAFFRRFEKKGGSVKEKEKEKQSWLEGGAGDVNSAESYFGKFSERGGKLDDETVFKSKITFDRVKNDQSGGKDV